MHAVLFPLRHQHIPCDTYGCRNTVEAPESGRAKWAIGRTDSNLDGPMSITHHLCNDCVRHMLAHAPVEMTDGGATMKAKIQAELDAKYEELRKAQQDDFAAKLREVQNLQVALTPEAAQVEEEKPSEPAIEETLGAIFRCLECDREFSRKAALASHMRTHQ